MKTYKTLYIWWIVVLLLATSVFWVGYEGYIIDIWNKDVTYITSLIAMILIYGIVMMGMVAYEMSLHSFQPNMMKIRKLTNRVLFLSEFEMGLAIVGTGIGIILLLGVNSDINVADQSALQTLLTHLWSTLGVAFYPNAVGLISSLILKSLAHFITEDVFDEA